MVHSAQSLLMLQWLDKGIRHRGEVKKEEVESSL